MIESFLYPFTQRILSGWQSMYGYEKEKSPFLIIGGLLFLFPFLVGEMSWIFFLFFLLNSFVVYMKTASFKLHPNFTFLKRYFDIHLWENFVTGGIIVYMTLTGYNILLLMCSVYPALILHKGLINIGSNLPFFATATDDETGKTYGIPLLGIKIKRSGNKIRLILTAISLIATILICLSELNLSIN